MHSQSLGAATGNDVVVQFVNCNYQYAIHRLFASSITLLEDNQYHCLGKNLP
jgi:hypothetical protein